MAKMPTTDEWVEQIGNKAINEFVYEGRTLKEWIDLMASGKSVILHDNATNGDVIKAVFPDIDFYEGEVDKIGGLISFYAKDEHGEKRQRVIITEDWWNAPYKEGDTDGNS